MNSRHLTDGERAVERLCELTHAIRISNYLADKALERRDYKQAMMYRQEARDARREQREIETRK